MPLGDGILSTALRNRGLLLNEIERPPSAQMGLLAGGLGGLVGSTERDPSFNYGGLLPFRKPKEGGPAEWGLGYSDLLKGLADAFTAPRRAWEGDVREGDALNFALMLQGGSAPGLLGRDPKGVLGITAYHASPHLWKPEPGNPLGRFRREKVGTGEGNAAYGHAPGGYWAEAPGTAQTYQYGLAKPEFSKTADGVELRGRLPDMLEEAYQQVLNKSGGQRQMVTAQDAADIVGASLDRQMKDALKAGNMKWFGEAADMRTDLSRFVEKPPKSPGYLYKADIPDEAVGKMLDWDKPLSQQPESVRKALNIDKQVAIRPEFGNISVAEYYVLVGRGFRNPSTDSKEVAGYFASKGIPGIKYLDQGSRAGGEGTRNFVLFEEDLAKIVERK